MVPEPSSQMAQAREGDGSGLAKLPAAGSRLLLPAAHPPLQWPAAATALLDALLPSLLPALPGAQPAAASETLPDVPPSLSPPAATANFVPAGGHKRPSWLSAAGGPQAVDAAVEPNFGDVLAAASGPARGPLQGDQDNVGGENEAAGRQHQQSRQPPAHLQSPLLPPVRQ